MLASGAAGYADDDYCHRMADDILPLEDVALRVGALERSYVGIRAIPVERVVGTLDRSKTDFDRAFTPLRRDLRQRLAALRRRYPDGDFPPIQVVELGGVFFVIDGHHRVALARSLGIAFIDAEITALRSQYAIPPDVDVRTLIHTEQQRLFEQRCGLAHGENPIEFSRPYGYAELLEVISAWSYDLCLREARVVPMAEATQRWLLEVYEPAVAALNRAELPRAYDYKTDADLFMWVYQIHRTSLVERTGSTFDDAARQARTSHVSRGFRRRFMRARSSPLQERLDAHRLWGGQHTNSSNDTEPDT